MRIKTHESSKIGREKTKRHTQGSFRRSWGHATAKPHSDLDLVAFTSEKTKLSRLREALEESSITIRVDLHIWSKLPPDFKKNIRSSYLIFQ